MGLFYSFVCMHIIFSLSFLLISLCAVLTSHTHSLTPTHSHPLITHTLLLTLFDHFSLTHSLSLTLSYSLLQATPTTPPKPMVIFFLSTLLMWQIPQVVVLLPL